MVWYRKKQILEDFVIIGGLVLVQFVYAGNSILLSYLMSLGLEPLTIVIFSTFATFLIISPAAIYFEWSRLPKEFSLKLLIRLVLISFGGVTLFQSLFLKGIKLTSPAMATAMPNLAPGIIFIIAWILRLEKVTLSCVYSKVKIGGTLLCVIGALLMSLMNSTESAKKFSSNRPAANMFFDVHKIIGSLYLMAAVFVLASNVVLQATTLVDFPAPMSLCAITSLIGVVITAAVQLIQNHKLDIGWPLSDLRTSFAILYFNGWAMKKRGPVLVSVFSPIATVISVVFSVITIGDRINLGSFAGMFLMFSGLYFVLWAKNKEGHPYDDHLESEFDLQKPLLA
ncbi:integral membrane family protein [Salix suchowensis]|nr:integral membrane family protein [Salix suchowensis]